MGLESPHRSARKRYWKDKDLASTRRLLEEGIATARHLDPEKPTQYDVDPFRWPGWNEVGIFPMEDDLRAGERAARENLRLARTIGRESGALAGAHFLLGAYPIAERRDDGADREFGLQREFAEAAGDPAGAALALGYATLSARPGGADVDSVIARLRASDWTNGPGFAAQLETAIRVFTP